MGWEARGGATIRQRDDERRKDSHKTPFSSVFYIGGSFERTTSPLQDPLLNRAFWPFLSFCGGRSTRHIQSLHVEHAVGTGEDVNILQRFQTGLQTDKEAKKSPR